MGDITMKITEIEKGKYSILSTYENNVLFSADGTPDELFFLYLHFMDKENPIDIKPIILIGSFKLFLNSLQNELSRTLRKVIKKKSFKKMFKILRESKVREI